MKRKLKSLHAAALRAAEKAALIRRTAQLDLQSPIHAKLTTRDKTTVVESFKPGGQFHAAGIPVGAIILGIDTTTITSPDHFAEVFKAKKSQSRSSRSKKVEIQYKRPYKAPKFRHVGYLKDPQSPAADSDSDSDLDDLEDGHKDPLSITIKQTRIIRKEMQARALPSYSQGGRGDVGTVHDAAVAESIKAAEDIHRDLEIPRFSRHELHLFFEKVVSDSND